MAESVTSFRTRRLRSVLLTLVAALLLALVFYAGSIAFVDTAYLTGWVLFAVILMLAFFNLRKRLTYPPLLKAATWLRLHVYLGSLAVLVFAFHTRMQIPTGALEVTLYLLFVALAASGFVGLYLSRTIPNSLADRGNEVIFERIPRFRRELGDRMQALVLAAVETEAAFILSDFYRDRLHPYLAGPTDYWAHLIRSTRPRELLLHELHELRRYLSDGEIAVAEELAEIIRLKYDLDFHYVRQGLLKIWLFIHIPLTWVLLLFLLAHIVIVYAFAGVFA